VEMRPERLLRDAHFPVRLAVGAEQDGSHGFMLPSSFSVSSA
jgi:hypothetical protein